MMRRVLWAVLVVLMAWPASAMAAILFYDNCEDYPDLQRDWLLVGVGPSLPRDQSVFDVSPEKARAGAKSYKFVLPPIGTDGTDSNSKRTEIRLAGLDSPININNWAYNQTFWMGYSIYIPSDFVWPGTDQAGDWGIFGQWHSAPDPCEATVILNPSCVFYSQPPDKQRFVVQGVSAACSTSTKDRWKEYSNLPLNKGAWNDVVLNFRFDYANPGTGFFKVWVNGAQVVNDVGRNCWNDAKGPFYKTGLYAVQRRWLTIYIDEFRVGDQNSSYAEVAPASGGGTAPPPPPLTILTAVLGELSEGATTAGTITATGGVPPYVFSSANKPSWFTVNADGTWSATPPIDGPYAFTVTCTDADSNTVQKDYSGTITDTTPPVVGNTDLQISIGGAHSIDINGNKTITIK